MILSFNSLLPFQGVCYNRVHTLPKALPLGYEL